MVSGVRPPSTCEGIAIISGAPLCKVMSSETSIRCTVTVGMILIRQALVDLLSIQISIYIKQIGFHFTVFRVTTKIAFGKVTKPGHQTAITTTVA